MRILTLLALLVLLAHLCCLLEPLGAALLLTLLLCFLTLCSGAGEIGGCDPCDRCEAQDERQAAATAQAESAALKSAEGKPEVGARVQWRQIWC